MGAEQQNTIERGAGRPEGGYTYQNRRIPGASKLAGEFGDKEGLMRWHWWQGFEEGAARAGLEKHHAETGRLYKAHNYGAKANKAGQLGTHVHDAIEKDIHGESGVQHLGGLGLSDDDLGKCMRAFQAYADWRSSVDIVVVATEVAMRSERYRFGGTLDAVARINGKLCLLDWKTSDKVRERFLVQLGAYAILWHETRGEAFDEAHLLCLSQSGEGFQHRRFSRHELQLGAEQLLLMRKAHDIDYRLRKIIEAQ